VDLVIKTSEKGWITELAKAYKEKIPAVLYDDAQVGINPKFDTIFQMGAKARLGVQQWTAVVVALGVAATGAYLVVMAVIDPEPFSKIAFALGAGTVMVLGGGFSAVQTLTQQRPPKITLHANGSFEIAW
jgi:hypothetical protein